MQHRPHGGEVIEALNDLLQLEHDTIGAIQAAMERLEDRDRADRIEPLLWDHQQRVRDLNALILRLGGKPANEPHAAGHLRMALQGLAALNGDRGVMASVHATIRASRDRYREYLGLTAGWPAEAAALARRSAQTDDSHLRRTGEPLHVPAGHAPLPVRVPAPDTGAWVDGVARRIRSRPLPAFAGMLVAGYLLGHMLHSARRRSGRSGPAHG